MLGQAEKRFQVDKEIIVAILLVESRFGENIGRRRVIPTLASMALMDSPDSLQNNVQLLLGVDPELSYELVQGVATRRAQWAYRELKYFLQILRNEKMDPLDVKCSYAGALGMPQFLPSSYVNYSMNSKSFEEWLSSKEAAAVSIANYLKSNGWKKTLSVEKKRQVIWSYNHSEPYIDTILQITHKIKAESHRPKAKTSPK
jgi:membrane-bound lytic murein transglycosylase B